MDFEVFVELSLGDGLQRHVELLTIIGRLLGLVADLVDGVVLELGLVSVEVHHSFLGVLFLERLNLPLGKPFLDGTGLLLLLRNLRIMSLLGLSWALQLWLFLARGRLVRTVLSPFLGLAALPACVLRVFRLLIIVVPLLALSSRTLVFGVFLLALLLLLFLFLALLPLGVFPLPRWLALLEPNR
jgi:hypothetical protein